jgi:DNA-binding transcriptional ArsR family regulator
MSYVAEGQDPFRAIADPRRRAMLDHLLAGERSVGELAARVGISQPAATQHIRVLKLAGLVEERREGRRTLCSVRPAELRVVTDWLAKYEAFWAEKLGNLERHLAKKIN